MGTVEVGSQRPATPDLMTRQNQDVTETKVRHVRIDEELWQAALAKAERKRETVSDVMRRALVAYVDED